MPVSVILNLSHFRPRPKGNLDIKYLSERYETGVRKCENFMRTHQRYVQLTSMDSGLPDTIGLMQDSGSSNKLLDLAVRIQSNELLTNCLTHNFFTPHHISARGLAFCFSTSRFGRADTYL